MLQLFNCLYLFHQFLWQQVLYKLSQVLPDHSLMEEGHSAVHQPDDGWRTVNSQLVGQATLITQINNANANTWFKILKKYVLLYLM